MKTEIDRVCETLAETMKSAYLAEIFDRYSEQDFRNMTKNYDIFIQEKRKEALLFAS